MTATSSVRGDTLFAELFYPRQDPVKHIEISLCDVRAADGLRLSYDFDRDGWSVQQASVFRWETDDLECDPCWQEVAFVQAWALKRDIDVDPA